MWTNHVMSMYVQHVSWLVVCRCGVQRQLSIEKVKVMQVRVDGPGLVKDEHWVLTDELEKLGD
jgi:hypothetical protein